jgi:hypothetical protein
MAASCARRGREALSAADDDGKRNTAERERALCSLALAHHGVELAASARVLAEALRLALRA